MQVKLEGADNLIAQLKENMKLDKAKLLVKAHGAQLQQKAQKNCNFKGHYEGKKFVPPTGTLKRSITLSIANDGLEARINTGVEYAGYVEYGTRFMKAQPYMRPALQEQEPKFINDMRRLCQGG